MRRNIELPGEHWDILKVLADDLGYHSRQYLLQAVIESFVNQFPDAKFRAMDLTAQRESMEQAKEDFERIDKKEDLGMIRKPTAEEIRELWGDDIDGLTDGVKEQLTSAQAVEEYGRNLPELPEL